MRSSILVALAAVLSSASPVRAEVGDAPRFGAPGSLALSAERLFGVTHSFVSGGSDITTLSLLGPGGIELFTAPYSVPRLAIDWFSADGLSLGAGAEFAHFSSTGIGNGDATTLGFHPRVGFLVRVDDRLAFWPRAGLSFVHVSSGRDSNLLALTFEGQLVISALPHLAVTVAPALDVGVAATDDRVTQLGLHVGALVFF